ncbi:MAG: 16S rRNA (cytidine(1402)-2'-O)-methyltransferase [Saprospiraceae bacterium]|nr:16S rRNA (cytidine(1402)-2'-O)-methyltransferase [Saprospiraceae bacterium]
MLYLVPTPIGNLEDMTFRAVNTLKEVDLIIAEDTRTSGRLLKHYEIEKPLSSFHAFNEHKIVEHLTSQMIGGKKIALISDAGTPGISDPGFLLVRACVQQGIKVSCLPGAVAFIPALVSSGLSTDKFYFEGFLPHKKGRQTRLKYLAELPCTFIIYESPFRLVKCLQELSLLCGPDRKVCVAREISKLFEEVVTKPLDEMILYYTQKPPKGEIVVVVEGNHLKLKSDSI